MPSETLVSRSSLRPRCPNATASPSRPSLRLEAIERFLEAPHSRKWLSVEFHEILRVCKRFELITLANLKKNYATICTEIYEQFVYTRSLDWAA